MPKPGAAVDGFVRNRGLLEEAARRHQEDVGAHALAKGLLTVIWKTVFISDGAKLEAWYHELGHIIFGCVKNSPETWDLFKSLQQEAAAVYPVVTHEQMTPVQHPITNEPISPAPGQYVPD